MLKDPITNDVVVLIEKEKMLEIGKIFEKQDVLKECYNTDTLSESFDIEKKIT